MRRPFGPPDLEAAGATPPGGPAPPAAGNGLPLHDPQALGRLLQELEPRLVAVARRVTREPEAARDVVQNAYLKVLRHGHGFDGRSKVSTWLHRIVVNEALMWVRGEGRRNAPLRPLEEAPETALGDPAPPASDDLEARRRRDALRRGLAGLCPEDREVLVRCALEGHSYEEHGRQRGIHPDAVKSRAFRARRRLALQPSVQGLR